MSGNKSISRLTEPERNQLIMKLTQEIDYALLDLDRYLHSTEPSKMAIELTNAEASASNPGSVIEAPAVHFRAKKRKRDKQSKKGDQEVPMRFVSKEQLMAIVSPHQFPAVKKAPEPEAPACQLSMEDFPPLQRRAP